MGVAASWQQRVAKLRGHDCSGVLAREAQIIGYINRATSDCRRIQKVCPGPWDPDLRLHKH